MSTPIITGSALVAYKQTMITRLSAIIALAGVSVTYGFPDVEMPPEAIWFADAKTKNWDPIMRAGVRKLDEEFELELIVQVLKQDGDTQENADIRALQLVAAVQADMAAAPRPTDLIMWSLFEGWDHKTGLMPNGGGHGSRFDCRITVRSRLYPGG